MFTADGEQLFEALFQACEFGGIFLVGVFQMLERAGRVDIVARIDAHFLHDAGRHVGHFRIEMHVGFDVAEVFGLDGSLRGEAHIVASSLNDAHRLLHASRRVGCWEGGHALNAQRMVAAQRTVADAHLMRGPGMVIK